jgi:predicted permease
MPTLWERAVSASRLVAGFTRLRNEEREMRDEMQFHVDMQTEKLVADGMSREHAQRSARIAFGGTEQWREAARDELRSQPLDELRRDLRYAVATLRRYPAFAITAIATIGLGIAAAVTVFTIVDSLYLRPLPVPEGSRLVRIYFPHPEDGEYPTGLAGIKLLRDRVREFDAVVAHDSRNVLQVRVGDHSVEQHGAFVSANYWKTLGIRPRLGRFFTAAEDSVPDRDFVVVVSSTFWHTQLADDPAVVGQRIQIRGQSLRIIGVAPEGFDGIAVGEMPNDVWLPLMMAHLGRYDCIIEVPCRTGEALARLAPGASLSQARARVKTLERPMSALSFRNDSVRRLTVEPANGLRAVERADYLRLARLLAGVALLILVIACTNLSGLLIARGASREREMALRVSLGASRARLTRQLLTESLVIAVAGGLLGVGLSMWASRELMGFFVSDDEGFHHFFNLALDARVLAFAVAASVVATILFGVLPALTTSRANPAEVLKRGAGNPPSAALRLTLTAAQVGLAVVLLTGAGLLMRSVQALMNRQHFDARHVAVLRWRPDLAGYSPQRAATTLQQVLERLRGTPGVVSVAYRRCCGLLWKRSPSEDAVGTSTADTLAVAQTQFISPGFFKTLDVPMLAGREFTDADRTGTEPVVVVGEAVARRIWGAESPIDRTIRVGSRHARVIGVVADYQVRTALEAASSVVFAAYWQTITSPDADGDTRFAIRVAGDPAAALPVLQRTFSAVDQAVLVTEMMPMTAQIDAHYVQLHLGGAVLISAALLALFLSALGLYGVISFLVARRTREVGIRVALGASSSSVVRLFLKKGLGAALLGSILGLVVAYAGSHLLAAWLIGVRARDGLAFAVAFLVVTSITLVASYLPARRAARVDPALTLREE